MPSLLSRFTPLAMVATLLLGAGAFMHLSAQAKDLGIEGAIYEPIEEDFRVMLMRLLARQDWTQHAEALEESARDYTKNLPSYFVVRADKTQTIWKDVGIVTTEDITLPWVDGQTGSVFEPEQVLAVKAGTYLNPISEMPAAAIERLFVFDATDPEQMALARALMVENIPQLSFMIVAGDLGPIAKEMNRPIYHPAPSMLDRFHVTAVPTLIGFGKGQHQGHMAVTQFKLPTSIDQVKSAWFGLPYSGYTPNEITDFQPVSTSHSAEFKTNSSSVKPAAAQEPTP
ncbi:hypothetical protein LMG26857_03489 [Achromobacter anxifer]|uniref:hypothetical protein n=1 Tax=Achromobacter anxifer TaxID=1287737 RepID=UPI00155CFDE0|nr:hypothetical protein [Achromobacter anxifer]CAB5514430.1 hypothetical protein LMG26857_03489 [Achromobacter anxifer]